MKRGKTQLIQRRILKLTAYGKSRGKKKAVRYA